MTNVKKIGVLTSSRADYGIYQPLLKALRNDPKFKVDIIVFGMHLLKGYGKTIKSIRDDDFGEIHEVQGMSDDDSLIGIVSSYGELIKKFGDFWSTYTYDIVIALGDRFEMSAAVQAGIPFNLKFAHVHGGETTLGATDNIYRHQITLASSVHFTAAEAFSDKVKSLLDAEEHVYNVGALSLDDAGKIKLPEWEKVRKQFSICEGKFILVTIHPETVNIQRNSEYCNVIINTLEELSRKINVVITLPNADASGSIYRNAFRGLAENRFDKVFLVENFGRQNYFSAIKQSEILLGNTSSGIIEAATFNKYVINLGDRQKGRLQSDNIIDVAFNKKDILKSAFNLLKKDNLNFLGENKYHKKGTVTQILEILTYA